MMVKMLIWVNIKEKFFLFLIRQEGDPTPIKLLFVRHYIKDTRMKALKY